MSEVKITWGLNLLCWVFAGISLSKKVIERMEAR